MSRSLARTAGFSESADEGFARKGSGLAGGWYPTEVEGSDPKTMAEIGRGDKTFIKIGAFTFEAVSLP